MLLSVHVYVCLNLSSKSYDKQTECKHNLMYVSGQYFASTMVIVGMSVVATVIVLQFHHHNPDSGHMPHWVSYNHEQPTSDIIIHSLMCLFCVAFYVRCT